MQIGDRVCFTNCGSYIGSDRLNPYVGRTGIIVQPQRCHMHLDLKHPDNTACLVEMDEPIPEIKTWNKYAENSQPGKTYIVFYRSEISLILHHQVKAEI